jgi:hypothetical protein
MRLYAAFLALFGLRKHVCALGGETCLAAESGVMPPHSQNNSELRAVLPGYVKEHNYR